jgi:hypothetical protein
MRYSDVANLGRAQALAAQNRYGDALSTMLKGRTVKTSNDLYWLRSFYAGNGDNLKALAALQKSFELGYRDFLNANLFPAQRLPRPATPPPQLQITRLARPHHPSDPLYRSLGPFLPA